MSAPVGVPLRIVALLAGPVCMPGGMVHLDSMLAWAVAQVEGVPPATTEAEVANLEIPIEREPGGRFHLCSGSIWDPEEYETGWQNRRFPVAEAQAIGAAELKRVQINCGRQKTVRKPREAIHVRNDTLAWFCVGDQVRIEELLSIVRHVGKSRGVGLGKVRRWVVEPASDMWPGFPVVLDGAPLRPLPVDWPGLKGPIIDERALTYPYWLRSRRCLCAVPEVFGGRETGPCLRF